MCIPTLDVQATKELLHVDEDRLDLDDQEKAGWRVERQEIDPPALAIPIEAQFRSYQPSEAVQQLDQRLPTACMVGVEQPREILPSAPDVPGQRNAQSGRNAAHRPDAEARGMPALYLADRRSRHACTMSEIQLPPAPSMTQGSNGAPKRGIIHRSEARALRLPLDYSALQVAVDTAGGQRH
jgi:hypothetical protein